MIEPAYAHQPVLLKESIDALNIRPDGFYIDTTFGRGGHSRAILELLNEHGRLLALDQDPQAVNIGQKSFEGEDRIEIVHCNFSRVANVVAERGMVNRVEGILMDLGVSSPQLDDAARGFSFLRTGPLDMRMNTEEGESAMHWLARVELHELIRVLRSYGEERSARRIAQAIIEARNRQDITDTVQLADIIVKAVPGYEKHKHPATRSFQAIRIFINKELQALEQGLQSAVSVLAIGGRLAVISFHSLEDRIVKRFMRDLSSEPRIPAGLPVMSNPEAVPYRIVGKPRVATAAELGSNPRARSARMRVLERVK